MVQHLSLGGVVNVPAELAHYVTPQPCRKLCLLPACWERVNLPRLPRALTEGAAAAHFTWKLLKYITQFSSATLVIKRPGKRSRRRFVILATWPEVTSVTWPQVTSVTYQGSMVVVARVQVVSTAPKEWRRRRPG